MEIPVEKARPLISPRIVALISTLNEDGSVNASPYSWVFPFSYSPLLIAFGAGNARVKNSQRNAEREKEFVINFVSRDFGKKAIGLEPLHGNNQLEEAGLNPIDSKEVKAKGIKEAKTRFECRYTETLSVNAGDHVFVVGEVVACHCEAMKGDLPDIDKLETLLHVAGGEFRVCGEKIMIERKKN